MLETAGLVLHPDVHAAPHGGQVTVTTGRYSTLLQISEQLREETRIDVRTVPVTQPAQENECTDAVLWLSSACERCELYSQALSCFGVWERNCSKGVVGMECTH